MDSLMDQRWQSGHPPFDGDCLLTHAPLSVEKLRAILCFIIAELERCYSSEALYTFDDWHQHDGYVTERREASWEHLAELARNSESLITSGPGDAYVHRSFYPESLAFLLRYDVSDEYSARRAVYSGVCDLSAPANLIAKLLDLPTELRSLVRVVPAKEHFDRTYSG